MEISKMNVKKRATTKKSSAFNLATQKIVYSLAKGFTLIFYSLSSFGLSDMLPVSFRWKKRKINSFCIKTRFTKVSQLIFEKIAFLCECCADVFFAIKKNEKSSECTRWKKIKSVCQTYPPGIRSHQLDNNKLIYAKSIITLLFVDVAVEQ